MTTCPTALIQQHPYQAHALLTRHELWRSLSRHRQHVGYSLVNTKFVVCYPFVVNVRC